MTSSQIREQNFRASVDVEKTIVLHTDDNPNNNSEDYSEHPFVIDITDPQINTVGCFI